MGKQKARRISQVFLFGGLVYLLSFGVAFYLTGRRTHFQQFYLLDDTYIHLAVAKNLLRSGTFGVSPHVFSAISSSVVWPFLVTALFAVFGIHALTPLIMEVALSLLLLYLADRFYTNAEPGAPLYLRLGLQLVLVFSVSLMILTFGGMEHVLQLVADLLLLATLGRRLAGEKVSAITLCAISALVTSTRYEGLFLVFLGCLCLLWKRDWTYAVSAGISGLAPVIGMGLFSIAHGSHFLPNSLLIKAANPDQVHWRLALFSPALQGILGRYAWRHGVAEVFAGCCTLLVLGYVSRGALSTHLRWMLGVYVGTALLHSQFSRLGWIYRYEAYLLALGAFLLFCGISELWPKRSTLRLGRPALVICSFAIICLLPRTYITLSRIPHHAEAIYEQQFQMGLFLARYYPGAPIAANDIGAISFLGDHDTLDLAGLGTVEVTNLIASHSLTTSAIRQLAGKHQTQVAVAYPTWFLDSRQLPPEWTKVRSWNFDPSRSDAVGGLEVVFYAVRQDQIATLGNNLADFASQVPPSVNQRPLP